VAEEWRSDGDFLDREAVQKRAYSLGYRGPESNGSTHPTRSSSVAFRAL